MNQLSPEYKNWLIDLKSKIRSVQAKAALAVNSALITFYWELGKMISEKESEWGSKLLETLSRDLKEEFPSLQGLSVSNLKYCRAFYQFYMPSIGQQPVAQFEKTKENQIIQQLVGLFGQQLVDQIPWGHNILIFTKSKDVNEARFYIQLLLVGNIIWK